MQQELYPNQPFMVDSFYERGFNRYKICGCIHTEHGGPLACFIWILINIYGCVLSFQGKSPLYSYLNHTMLIIQGVICLWFVISALTSLYIFTTKRPRLLRVSHRLTWTSVMIFLIYYFISLVIFGVQKDEFDDWCINRSRQDVDQTFAVSVNGGSRVQITYTPSVSGSDLYNCNRLWESEIKFSSVVFVILFVIYFHFAFCFWIYTQEMYKQIRIVISNYNSRRMNGMSGMNNTMPNQPPPQLNNIMNNMIPQVKEKLNGDRNYNDDSEQKSLAQATRAFFSKLKR